MTTDSGVGETMAGMDGPRLTVRDVVATDLDGMTWVGSPTHRRTMAAWLGRVVSGVVDYLCVCGPAGVPLAMGGVGYATRPGRAEIWQLATMPALQSLGLGTLLIGALEDRARERGFPTAMLLVEDDNPRALALYQRLGYAVVGEEIAEWDAEDADGRPYRHRTACRVLERSLG